MASKIDAWLRQQNQGDAPAAPTLSGKLVKWTVKIPYVGRDGNTYTAFTTLQDAIAELHDLSDEGMWALPTIIAIGRPDDPIGIDIQHALRLRVYHDYGTPQERTENKGMIRTFVYQGKPRYIATHGDV